MKISRYTVFLFALIVCVLLVTLVVLVHSLCGQASPLSARAVVVAPGQMPHLLPCVPGNVFTERLDGTASDITVGLFAPNLYVSIRNNLKGAALVLRSVNWANYREDEHAWLTPHPGSAGMTEDGRVTCNPCAQCLSGLLFEAGLIFPNEELLVSCPMTPQPEAERRLVIRYAVIRDWKREVLLPTRRGNISGVIYVPVTDAMLRSRKGKSDGDAVVKCTCEPSAKPLLEDELVVPVKLPVKSDPGHKKTGGLSSSKAAELAGLNTAKTPCLSFYREPMKAWFFVKYDRTATALRRKDGKWKRVAMPDMDWTAPDEFGTYPETRWTTQNEFGAHQERKEWLSMLLLRPDVFGSIVKVSLPTLHGPGWFNPGVTSVNSEHLWRVLETAKSKRLDLRLITLKSSGMSRVCTLSAGVTLDRAGHWIDPRIEPRWVRQ